MNRRTFLSASAATLAAAQAVDPAEPDGVPILDTHVHLYDPTRPEGVPWPPKTNTLIYKRTLPDRLREVSAGLGVVGAIEVECSPWLQDNQWVLDVMEKDPIMVGTIGNLEPGKPGFAKHLERFAKNPLFLGIRYGYLWDRDLRAELAKPTFVKGLRMLADRGLDARHGEPDGTRPRRYRHFDRQGSNASCRARPLTEARGTSTRAGAHCLSRRDACAGCAS